MEGENGHAGRDGYDDEVFVEWIAFFKERNVEEHDGEQFTGFGEDKGNVIYVGEGGVAKGRGEGRCKADCQEGNDHAARGNQGWEGFVAWSAEAEVEVA